MSIDFDSDGTAEIDENGTEEEILNINELTVSNSFHVENVNGHHIKDLLRSNSNLDLNEFKVTFLVAPSETKFTDTDSALDTKRLKREIAPPRAEETEEIMNLGDVLVEGSINGVNLSYILENALRTNVPEQRLESTVNFNTIRASSTIIKNEQISGINLNRVASIGANITALSTPVVFERPLAVNVLNVLHRINQIQVVNGKSNILLKRSRRVQTINGDKTFAAVNLIEPIILQGRINVSSPVMSKMKPIVTVDDELIIDGDVLISGNVTVKISLESNNLFGQSVRYSLAQVQGDGLRTDEANIDVPLEFSQPIQVNDIRSPTRLNGISLESFVKRNTSQIQRISAPKTIISDLRIENGFCEANEINGINVQLLNNTMLKRSAENQTVTGTLQIRRIVAENVNSGSLSFGKVPIDHLLTKSTNQIINGNVKIHGNVIIANGSVLNVDHLITQNNVFGVNLTELLDDSYNYANETVLLTSDKWFDSISIDRLIIESDFWPEVSTADVVKRLQTLTQGVLFNESVAFSDQFSIDNAFVLGTINNIPNSEFGQSWLLYEGKQVSGVALKYIFCA